VKDDLSPGTSERRDSSPWRGGAESILPTSAFLVCLASQDAVRLPACISWVSIAYRHPMFLPIDKLEQEHPRQASSRQMCRAHFPPVIPARGNASRIGGDLRSLRRSRRRSARGLSYPPMMQAYSPYSLAARAHVSACSSFASRESLPGMVEMPRRAAFNSDMRRTIARITTNCRRE
jgi:hypothetical protein